MRIIVIISLSLLSLLSCVNTPCKWIIAVHSETDNAYVKIEDGEKQADFYLNSGDSFERNISDYRSGTVIIIKTSNLSKTYRIGEYDHWFARTHNIKILIKSSAVDFDSGGLGMQQLSESDVRGVSD